MVDFFKDFGWFCWAVIKEYVYLAAGCALTVMIAIYERHIKKQALSYRAEVSVLAVFIFLACFGAWRVEHKKTDSGVTLKLEGAGVGIVMQETSAIVFADVTNVGMPSIVDSWQLQITSASGKIIVDKVLPTSIRSDQTFSMSTSPGRAMKFSSDDALYKKTSSPIPTGDKVSGFLWFQLPGVSNGEVDKVGTVYTVRCKNVWGGDVHSSFTLTSISNTLPNLLPGMKEPTPVVIP